MATSQQSTGHVFAQEGPRDLGLAATSSMPSTQGPLSLYTLLNIYSCYRPAWAPACRTKGSAKTRDRGQEPRRRTSLLRTNSWPYPPEQEQRSEMPVSHVKGSTGREEGSLEWTHAPCAYGLRHNRPRLHLPRGAERKPGLSCT